MEPHGFRMQFQSGYKKSRIAGVSLLFIVLIN
jgi:hypothetical protein